MKKKLIIPSGIVALVFATTTASAHNQDFASLEKERWDYHFDVNVAKSQPEKAPEKGWTTPAALYYSLAETEDITQNLITKINDQRTKEGMPNLTLSPEISRIALAKAKDMYYNEYINAVSPTYGTAEEMVSAFGYENVKVLQLIQTNEQKTEHVASLWKNNKELAQFIGDEIGLAVFGEKGTDKMYWVLMGVAQ